jgi:hypothetical protein
MLQVTKYQELMPDPFEKGMLQVTKYQELMPDPFD